MIMQIPRAGRWLEVYVRYLLQLHRLIARSLDEGPEGDALRDQMDLPWRRMTPEEIRTVRDLSADLYTITDPAPASAESMPTEVDTLLSRALRDEDWVRVLHIIREYVGKIPLHSAAFLRGYCWSQLGLFDAGAEFFEHAVRLEPDQLGYRTYLLTGLVRAGRESDALSYAEKWIVESTDPALLFAASTVLFLNAEASASTDSTRLHELAIEVAERAIQNAGQGQAFVDVMVKANLHVAISYAELQDFDRAKAAWQRAKQLAPNSLDVILVGGALEHSDELSVAARRDVARELVGVPSHAIEKSARSSFPFALGSTAHSILPN
jgi:tetratricopeptide (TPR) repeat protein